MKKREIARLVVISILTVLALIGCVLSVSVRVSISEQTSQNADDFGQAIGLVAAASMGVVVMIIFSGAVALITLITVIVSAVGIHRARKRTPRTVFGSMLAANLVILAVTLLGSFAGL